MKEKRVKVAFQGERGAYSEEAIFSFFKSEVEVLPYATLNETFESVTKKNANFAVVPVENSLEGSINETYDLLLSSTLKIQGEINLRIKHSLIARPEIKKKNIHSVYSHPQALAQCRKYIKHLGATPIATYDTAGSVKIIRKNKSNDVAAIASSKAASIYGMNVLEDEIEDNSNNYTRFFSLSFGEMLPTGNDKTSIIFSTKDVPGALYKVLKEFSDKEINLTKIESRPTRKKAWEYNFYLDFEGHKDNENC
ncbi:prephenate dehydratase, partial [Thermoproteota archaeon]